MTDKELRELAERATNGPWTLIPQEDELAQTAYYSVWAEQWINKSGNKDCMAVVAANEDCGGCQTLEDAAFIAAANPARIISLLDQKAALLERIAAADRLLQELADCDLTVKQHSLVRQALATLAAESPICKRCGEAIDPDGPDEPCAADDALAARMVDK